MTGVTRPASGVPLIPVALLRVRVEHELAHTSLRRAASEIGLSPNALRNFLLGAEPRRSTRVKLERWLAQRPRAGAGSGLRDFLRLLHQLAGDLSERDVRLLGREVSRLLLDSYRRNRIPPPRWVKEVARHYGGESA